MVEAGCAVLWQGWWVEAMRGWTKGLHEYSVERWRSFFALDTRGRLYVAFGHGSRQAADVVLQEPVFALELVVVQFDLVDSFCQSLQR
jgi:hypothetical protein